MSFLLIVLALGGTIWFLSSRSRLQERTASASSIEDAQADARRWIERLGSQIYSMSGMDKASTQALADASERFTAANSQIASANTVRKAQLARESALEGLYYVNAAREIMGLPQGPELPPLEGQRKAGQVTETRTIEHEGQSITASPTASPRTPNYYPGGVVAGRPVPAGWYSTPWWAGALSSGMWTAASVMMFSSLFSGMSGVGYSAQAFENGYGNGYEDGLAAAEGGEVGELGNAEAGDYGDMGGDSGGFEDLGEDAGGFGDVAGGDDGGFSFWGDFGGGDGGGFGFGGDGFDFGGFDF